MRLPLAVVASLPLAAGCGDGSASSTDSDGGGGGDAALSSDGGGGDDGGTPDATIPGGLTLQERLTVSSVTVPSGVEAGVSNWRIWGTASLRLAPTFTAPLSSCETLVGYTGQDGTARAVRIDDSGELVETHDLAANRQLRGLAAEPDGHFAALLWDDASDKMYVHRFDAAGNLDWSEELNNANNVPDDFGIGEARFEYGNGRYGAYYHVHGIAGFQDGHEGDSLKFVTTAGAESTAWDWGCSHSMSAALRYNEADDKFMPACVTDCYPGTSGTTFSTDSIGSIVINRSSSNKVLDVNAGCNGRVAGELGSAAIAPSGWAMSFNAHQNAATMGQSSYDSSTMNQDIGFTKVASNYSPGGVVWLTDTPDIDEADSTVARWEPAGDATEQYVVGWAEPGAPYSYKLARVGADGAILEGPTDITATAQWGRRDDPMRRHTDGDIVWAWFDDPGSTTLKVARLESGQAACTP